MPAINLETTLKRYDKRYYSLKLKDEVIQIFEKNVNYYLHTTNAAIESGETEEHLKNLTNTFLKRSLYCSDRYEINTDKRIDSTIKVDGKIQALIETKKPSNKSEMVTEDNVNVKALHEIIFYYLSETRNVADVKVKRIPDVEIRRIIITDTKHWVLIDANEIEKLVDGYLEKLYYKYQNKQLIYSNNTEKFYADIKQYFDTIDVNELLKYAFFDIDAYAKGKKLNNLYKILHRTYLLKESTKNNDSVHVLNNRFYQELLYIMGLKEKSGKSSKTIEIDFNLKNSLADQVYRILKNDKEYDEITCIEETFELVIIWMNRLLFIKLFEGQLIAFNGNRTEYHILDNDKITSFQNLQDLFFEVLGKRERDNTEFLKQFSAIPYLNSSLFERQEIERKDLNINSIRNEKIIRKNNSAVGTKADTELFLLDYIIGFLNSYSFSSEIGKNNTIVEGRDIIDASVLGLIFEKLNGYRDGSFYTPSIITEYMCLNSIEQAVIDKINYTKGWHCADLFEIRATMDRTLAGAREINNIINSVKICDPSVGSGHFLVSALNRMIAIKKQLGVLFKYEKTELLTEYDIDIVDDVIKVFDGQGHPFHYNINDSLSQSVQETLFNEKRIIIENCLFGVDINPKAVAICQLRLWIELLKNAYYKNGIMETLPNIDINIKSGNSLINRLDFTVGKKVKGSKESVGAVTSNLIKQYKQLVQDYKKTSDKSQKIKIKNNIDVIKNNLHDLFSQIEFSWGKDNELKLNYGQDMEMYRDAFEWAIEFPELLDENCVFQGFDCVIGNPPYGLLNKKQNQNTSISIRADLLEYYKKNKYYSSAKGGVLNIYRLFICRCFMLLKPGGHCCLIFPLAFMCDLTAKEIRKYIMENTQIDYLEAFPERDNENKRVFKEVKMSVCILGASKKKVQDTYKFGVRINRDRFVDENNEVMKISYQDILKIDDASISIPLIKQRELGIFLKMTEECTRMNKISKCYTGEIDISLDKKYITTSAEDDLMLRGAQVQKYYITNDISQGEIFYLKAGAYQGNNNSIRASHHKKRRIVMQGITGINEKWRLKMTMAYSPFYCANSVNYLMPTTEEDFDYYILGLLNSKLLNWYFSKLSTNSNVNGYEIDALPIRIGTKEQCQEIITMVKSVLEKPNDELVRQIDTIVYSMYGITQYDIPIIEG